jgi:diadenosine tetraphosphate (Ap4A) HIT family hydrolase
MSWWPEDEWARMLRGDDCAMCADSALRQNPHGDLLVETEWSFIRLCTNQTQAGYSVVISKRHAAELHDLTPPELGGFWTDVADLGQAIDSLFQPVKLANLSMGFRMPHVHCHVYPQYQRDDPFKLINPQDGEVRLAQAAWDERVQLVRHAFTTLRGNDR